jgi:hypothetical protein
MTAHIISSLDIDRCPRRSLNARHYRPDGSCRCDEDDQQYGWWGMPCWNGLSAEQQRRLIEVGGLPFGYEAEGDGCKRGAQCCVETMDDEAPGPRFYCFSCGIAHLLRSSVASSRHA